MNGPDPRRRLCLQAGLLALPVMAPRLAHALDTPAGPVVLTVSARQVSHANTAGKAAFDMAMLEKLPQRSFSTRTPWYPEARKFTGPLLRDVLDAAGVQGTQLRAIALNDYKVAIPFDDVTAIDVVLARLMDDRPMSIRDKGPLFIIYPFDSRSDLRNTIYYSRCAWQLKAIEVL